MLRICCHLVVNRYCWKIVQFVFCHCFSIFTTMTELLEHTHCSQNPTFTSFHMINFIPTNSFVNFSKNKHFRSPSNPIHFDCVSAPGALEILTACFCSLTAGQLYSDLIICASGNVVYLDWSRHLPSSDGKTCLVVHRLKRNLHSHNVFQIRASVKI